MSTCLNAEEALQKGNHEFLDKNYKSAMEMYNLAIELDENVSDAYVKRALCHEKMKQFRGMFIMNKILHYNLTPSRVIIAFKKYFFLSRNKYKKKMRI